MILSMQEGNGYTDESEKCLTQQMVVDNLLRISLAGNAC